MTRLVLTTPSQHLLKDTLLKKSSRQQLGAEKAANAEIVRLTEKYKYGSKGWRANVIISTGCFVFFFLIAMSCLVSDPEEDPYDSEVHSCKRMLIQRGAQVLMPETRKPSLTLPEDQEPMSWRILVNAPFSLLVALLVTSPITAYLYFVVKYLTRHNYLEVRPVTLLKSDDKRKKKDKDEGKTKTDSYGFRMKSNGPVVTEVTPDGPADGLIELGETVLAINGVRLFDSFRESTISELLEAREDTVELHVRAT